jgi:hypothetical protein
MGSSQTRFGNVDRIFRINTEKRLLDAQLARLCVLFEDMRIESKRQGKRILDQNGEAMG